MKHWLPLVLLLLTSLALVLRVSGLGNRPMHGDEAVNAVKFGRLWDQGYYKYDPKEFHGPTLPYFTLVLERLTGAPGFRQFTESRLRAVTVVFGLGLILLLPLVADGLGRSGTAWAAVLTAVSPSMVFYSGYYIHEMLLVCFTFLTLGAGWRYSQTGQVGWALLAGIGLGLMQATKETFAITIVSAVVAIGINFVICRTGAGQRALQAPRANPKLKHAAAGLLISCLASVILFSSFFSNAEGPIDAFRTYIPWLSRAGGESPHGHPWTFYLERLLWFHAPKGPVWSEAFILVLAAAGAFTAFWRTKNQSNANEEFPNPSFIRSLAIYTIVLTAFYCLIPYKTPWCMLSPWHGMILLAGAGAAALVRRTRRNAIILMVVLLLAGVAHLAWQAWQATGSYAADRRNPYVYAHTSPDVLRLANQLKALANASPQKQETVVKVIAPEDDYWPLPWYLRHFEQVGWWNTIPKDAFAPIMIVSSKLNAALDEKHTHVMPGYFALRPDAFFELYVELDLWKAYLAANPPKKDRND